MTDEVRVIDVIEEKIGENFCKEYGIDIEKKYVYEWISAKELIVSNRIDLVAKYKYVEAKEKGLNTDFFRILYEAHIDAFSHGTFIEPGKEDTKNSLEKYISVFDELIDSIKQYGIDPSISIIPVGADNEIMDGAHRVAIAAYYDQKIPIIRFSELHANNGAEFFLKRDLSVDYLDYLIYEYAKLKKNVDVIILWPKAGKKPELYQHVIDELNTLNVIYHRSIKTNMHMLRNFMIQVYSGYEWLGALNNNFSGASKYAEQCYDKNGKLEVFVVEGSTKEQRNVIKAQIRGEYGFGNSSIHSTDNCEEALEIMRMLFNKNSRHFLSFGNPGKYKKYNEMIVKFREEVVQRDLNEKVILDSGAVLAAYGLRNTYDLDYLSDHEIAVDKMDFDCDRHDKHIYKETIDELLYNPSQHFYYWGMKFVSIYNVKQMKEMRYSAENNTKDLDDIKLIDTVGNGSSLYDKVIELVVPIKRSIHNIEFRIEKMLSTAYIFKPARYVYHKIKGTEYHG